MKSFPKSLVILDKSSFEKEEWEEKLMELYRQTVIGLVEAEKMHITPTGWKSIIIDLPMPEEYQRKITLELVDLSFHRLEVENKIHRTMWDPYTNKTVSKKDEEWVDIKEATDLKKSLSFDRIRLSFVVGDLTPTHSDKKLKQ